MSGIKTRTTKNFWESYTQVIDTSIHSKWLKEYHDEEEKRILGYCQENRPTRVLELGCGHGRLIDKVIPFCSQIVGLDFSLPMVNFCSQRFKNESKVLIYEADISEIPFPDEHFDLGIIAYNTFGNLDTGKEKFLLEVGRVLKSRAGLIISVYAEGAKNWQHHEYIGEGLTILQDKNSRVYTKEGLISQRFSRNDLEAWLQIGGFGGKVEQLTDYTYFVIAQKKPL